MRHTVRTPIGPEKDGQIRRDVTHVGARRDGDREDAGTDVLTEPERILAECGEVRPDAYGHHLVPGQPTAQPGGHGTDIWISAPGDHRDGAGASTGATI